MSIESNDVILGVALLERAKLTVKPESREPIKLTQLNTAMNYAANCLSKLRPHCQESLVLSPIVEATELIDFLLKDENLVETDKETKDILVTKFNDALYALYLFAGKFYVTHEFKYSLGQADILRRIIDSCLAQGYYFGYDKKLMEAGEI